MRDLEPKSIPTDYSEPANVTEEQAYNAAAVMAGIAVDKIDPACGLLIVLDALSIKEMAAAYRDEQTS